jgi:hypothetical protein
MECDAEHAQAEVAQQDYLARMHTFTSSSKHSIICHQMLEECQILLSLSEMDLEVREVKLVEEQVRGLHSFDGWDLSAEQGELHTHVAEVEDEHIVEAKKLSMLVVGISNALVNLGMLPIWDIP